MQIGAPALAGGCVFLKQLVEVFGRDVEIAQDTSECPFLYITTMARDKRASAIWVRENEMGCAVFSVLGESELLEDSNEF